MNRLLEQAKKLKLKLIYNKKTNELYSITAFRLGDIKVSILINNYDYIYFLEQPQTKKIDELLQKLIQKVKNIDENTINQLFLEHNKQIDKTQSKIFDIHKSDLNYYKYKKQGEKCYYWLDKKLTNDQKQTLLENYNNIEFYNSNTEYAPELTANVICIYEGGK